MLRRYGFIGAFKLLMSLIYTKLFFPGARLIRLPFDIRNKRNIIIGNGFTTGFGCRVEAFPEPGRDKVLIIGNNVEINDYVHIAARNSIIIGNNVLIASKVFISDLNHGSYKGKDSDSPMIAPKKRKEPTNPVVLKDNVWLGEGVCIMPGVTLGFGCVIGALSVVTKDIPDYCIAVGTPAKVIKKFDFNKNEWVAV